MATYFQNNAAYMRYNEYLALGFPIASGPVEGACKNLIKDRMERSGMRWTPSMAEAIVKLRSLYLSGDFDDYWPFHVAQDQLRLHPPRLWFRRRKIDTPAGAEKQGETLAFRRNSGFPVPSAPHFLAARLAS